MAEAATAYAAGSRMLMSPHVWYLKPECKESNSMSCRQTTRKFPYTKWPILHAFRFWGRELQKCQKENLTPSALNSSSHIQNTPLQWLLEVQKLTEHPVLRPCWVSTLGYQCPNLSELQGSEDSKMILQEISGARPSLSISPLCCPTIHPTTVVQWLKHSALKRKL